MMGKTNGSMRLVRYTVWLFAAFVLLGCGDKSNGVKKDAVNQISSNFLSDQSIEDVSQAIDWPADRPNIPDFRTESWDGVKKKILQCFLSGQRDKRCNIGSCRLVESGRSLNKILSLDIKLNAEGVRVVTEIFSSGYLVRRPDGSLYVVTPNDLTDSGNFQKLRSEYLQGANVQRVGFSGSVNVRRLLMAANMNDSRIEEVVGVQRQRPQDFILWRDEYQNRTMSRIYKFDPNTGEEGPQTDWIVDLYRPRVHCDGDDRGHFVLKAIIPFNSLGTVNQKYIVARPSRTISEGKEYFDYDGEVVDDNGNASSDGIYLSFRPALTFYDINGPSSN